MQDCVARRQVWYYLHLTWEHAQRQILTVKVRERKTLHAAVLVAWKEEDCFFTDPFKTRVVVFPFYVCLYPAVRQVDL